MLFVACGAAIDRARVVFVNERSAFILVTGDAECLGICSQLVLLVAAVRVMTIGARHDAFGQAMMRRLVKIGACRLVAVEAEFGWFCAEHRDVAFRVHRVLVVR